MFGISFQNRARDNVRFAVGAGQPHFVFGFRHLLAVGQNPFGHQVHASGSDVGLVVAFAATVADGHKFSTYLTRAPFLI